MSRMIENIEWPKRREDITFLILSYKIKVIEELNVNFPKDIDNPLIIAKSFASGEISLEQYNECYENTFDYIDKKFGFRNFDQETLIYRLGLNLLSAHENHDELTVAIDWFIDLIARIGLDLSCGEKIMNKYFTFKE